MRIEFESTSNRPWHLYEGNVLIKTFKTYEGASNHREKLERL